MTQTHLTTTLQLRSLADLKIGVKEAATLFALRDGLTVAELAKFFRTTTHVMKSRLSPLRNKGLIESDFNGEGVAVYHPTARGLEIINKTLK